MTKFKVKLYVGRHRNPDVGNYVAKDAVEAIEIAKVALDVHSNIRVAQATVITASLGV